MNEKASQPKTTIVAERPDYFLCGLFILVWLLPITWVGMTKKSVPLVGTYANDMYRVASLFTKRSQGPVDYYFQVQFEDGWDWENISKRDYSKIIMSGNRTRIDRMLQDSVYSPRGMKQRQQLAEYIKEQYERQHPDHSKIDSFRYLIVFFPVGEMLVNRKGGWTEWPIEKIPEKQQTELSVHYFDGRPGKNSLIESMRSSANAQPTNPSESN